MRENLLVLKIAFFILFLICLTIVGKGQITTAKIQHITYNKSTDVSINYDGYSNIQNQRRIIDYQQYVGLKAYLIKGAFDYVSTSKYYTITNIDAGKESQDRNPDNYDSHDYLKITLKSENSNDSLIYKTNLKGNHQYDYNHQDSAPFDYLILVPYFLHEKKIHDGEEFVIVNKKGCYYDEAREELFTFDKPLYGGIWKCEVTMYAPKKNEVYKKRENIEKTKERINMRGDIETHGGNYDLSTSNDEADTLERIKYLLKNNIGEIILADSTCSVNKLAEVGYYENSGFYSDNHGYASAPIFMPLKTFEKIINDAKKQRAQLIAKNLKASKELNKKYGSENTQLILHGKIKIGMNKEMCSIAWGGLYAIVSQVQDNSGVLEIWKHALYGTMLYFKGGKLYKIEN